MAPPEKDSQLVLKKRYAYVIKCFALHQNFIILWEKYPTLVYSVQTGIVKLWCNVLKNTGFSRISLKHFECSLWLAS